MSNELGKTLRELRRSAGLTQRDLGDALGISFSSVSMYERGERSPDVPHLHLLADYFGVSIDFLTGHKNADTYGVPARGVVPVYGCIPAGFPVTAEQNVESWMPVTVPNPDQYFALRVSGSSMINAGIIDGCKVLIHRQSTAENGQIVACRLNGDEATLKRFKRQDNTVLLLPENPDFDPRIVSVSAFESGEAEIIGVVRQIIIDI